MGLSKSNIFTAEQIELSNFAKALGHPARIAILQHLIQIESCICGDIVDEVGLAQATISQHLKELKQMGIIKGNIEGRKVCYCIDESIWTKMRFMLENFLAQKTKAESCC